MSSYNNPSEPTVQNMIMCFRVPELQSLLSFAGKNKSGRKQDLVNKSMQLLQSNTGNKTQIQNKVRDLYHRRIPQIPKSEHLVDSKMERYDPQEPTSGNSFQDFNLRFKPLPFYQQEEQLHAPAKLAPSGKSFDGQGRNMPCNKMKVTFTIHSSHLHLLDYSKRRPFAGQYSQRNSAQVQLRFNMMDDRPKHPERLPPHINIRLNDENVLLPPLAPQTKAGDDPRHFNRPINLTNQIMKPGRNKLCIKWTPNSESYAFVINIVKQQTVDDLLSKLEKRGLRPVHEARMDIKSMLHEEADAEISTMCLRVSLLCPLGKMRMITPARPRTCTHLQCFDVNFFLKMNENKPTWTCPVCDKPAEFDDIQIDEYFSQILRHCKEDEIEFNEDGSWNSTSIKKAETYVIGSSKSYDNALDLSWTQVQGRKEDKNPQPEVIDLTGDSSDEEDVPITPLPDNIHYNSGQVDLVASPPVSSSMGSISSRSSASTPYPPSMVHNQQWTSDEQLMTPPLPQTPKSSSHPYHVAPLRCSPRRDRLRYSPISSPYRSSSSSRPAVETPPAPLPIHEVNSIINNSTISSSNHLDVDVDSAAAAAAAMSNNVAVSMNQAAASVVSGMNGVYATGSPSLPSLHSQLSLNHLGNAALAAAFCQFGQPTGFPGLSEHANGYRQRHIYEYFMPPPPSAVSSGLQSPHSAYQQHSAAAASAALVSASSQLHQRTAAAVAASMSAAAAGRNPYSMSGFFPADVLMQHNSATGLQPHSSSTSLSSSVVNPLMSSRSPGDRSDPTSTGSIIPID